MKQHKPIRLLTFLALAVLFLAACQPAAVDSTSPPDEPEATATQEMEAEPEIPAATPTGPQIPQGWQTLNDPSQGYSLAYPPEWELCQETKYSRAYCEIQEEPEGMGPPPRLYVSVVPQDFTNPDFEAYNFYPIETIKEFMALAVGESMLKEPNAMAPEYFTYTRLPDQMVAGLTALVIENSKVWEFPSGTKDRVVFILTEDSSIMLGMYYETPEQLAMFEQVLDSFQIVP